MVGRKILDGLRKGKKDLYALNVQYVRRYRHLDFWSMQIFMPLFDGGVSLLLLTIM